MLLDSIHVIFLLKPEGVLQRALEVGYRGFADTDKFKVSSSTSKCEFLYVFHPS